MKRRAKPPHFQMSARRQFVSALPFWFVLVSCPVSVFAQPPPALRPPRGEIDPTFLEKHGWLVAIIAFAAIVAIALLVILLCRPKRKRIESPEALARRSLMALQNRSEDGALIMQVSQIFRRYVIFAFELPAGELTTAELNQALEPLPKTDPALVTAIGDFLRRRDEEKFAPHSRPPQLHAASRALELLEKIEVHRRRASLEEPAA